MWFSVSVFVSFVVFPYCGIAVIQPTTTNRAGAEVEGVRSLSANDQASRRGFWALGFQSKNSNTTFVKASGASRFDKCTTGRMTSFAPGTVAAINSL